MIKDAKATKSFGTTILVKGLDSAVIQHELSQQK
jgi:hypothetical protein